MAQAVLTAYSLIVRCPSSAVARARAMTKAVETALAASVAWAPG